MTRSEQWEQAVEDAFVAFEALGFVNVAADADYWARRDALVSVLRRMHYQEAAEKLEAEAMRQDGGAEAECSPTGYAWCNAASFLRGIE